MTQNKTDDAGAPPGVKVTAAGALCWRVRQGRLEVLLIHRPRYDDWSWPKGKLNSGETTPECAVREVDEEIGVQVRLGIPLPTIYYRVNPGLKQVLYWAAKLDKQDPVPDGNEVDRVLWCAPAKARELLSNPSDVEPLDALVEAHRLNELDTYPFVVVRHAKAKPRSAWSQAEGERPLVATGRRQALAVCRMLSAWKPKRIVSSPWLRCVQTVTPYVLHTQTKLRTVDAITEHNNERNPKKARAALFQMLEKGKPTAVCTHRPVLPNLFKVLADRMDPVLAEKLPTEDPYLRPGAVLVCHISKKQHGKIVAMEILDAYDD
ncbi:NUDIX hydrolase [Arthrobacter sp. CAU 1506]|uniref:NUDIX hydrolase n=1 Tax=Arthrobacter sp. CAU 1506 TaxID=2560052 RepID=UPI0010ACFC51|nr:NUDIX hydrolase [Arthrobacter sp. CAU 1506]TJY71606.1 NUDIX hydrolase [Arthrobacter sp. CAU 1506]